MGSGIDAVVATRKCSCLLACLLDGLVCCVEGGCPAASVFQNTQGCHGSNLIVGSAPDEIASKLSTRPAAVDETLNFYERESGPK